MASPSDNPLKRLIREIHRRSLWQVLGIYLLASWVVLGGVGTLGDVLALPDCPLCPPEKVKQPRRCEA